MTKTTADSYRNILENGRWFKGLSEDLKSRLMTSAKVVRLCSGDMLFSRGDTRCGLYAVVEGAIRITGVGENGKEAILTFIEPPNWIGEIALFDSQLRTHDAIAEDRVTAIHTPQEALDKILADNPIYWRDFGLLIAHKLRLAFLWMEDMTLLPAAVRLARRLVFMAEGYGELQGKSRRTISVPQEQLGLMLGISRQTTNQILKELETQGMIKVAYGVIELLDLEGLKKRSTVG